MMVKNILAKLAIIPWCPKEKSNHSTHETPVSRLWRKSWKLKAKSIKCRNGIKPQNHVQETTNAIIRTTNRWFSFLSRNVHNWQYNDTSEPLCSVLQSWTAGLPPSTTNDGPTTNHQISFLYKGYPSITQGSTTSGQISKYWLPVPVPRALCAVDPPTVETLG